VADGFKFLPRPADTGMVMNFWKDAKRTQVTWRPGDPRLEALIAGSSFPGLYALVHGDCVLKVGEAGTVRNGKQGTVGKRLSKHVKDGCAPAGSSYPGEFPAWWEFSGALVGHELTIYTLRFDGPQAERRALEKDAVSEARGGSVLWEEMQRREAARIPGTKRPKRLVEPGAVRGRVLAELGR
jgi:hypothetical protein